MKNITTFIWNMFNLPAGFSVELLVSAGPTMEKTGMKDGGRKQEF